MTASDDFPSPKESHLPRGPWTLARAIVEAHCPQFLAAGLAPTQEPGSLCSARCPVSLRDQCHPKWPQAPSAWTYPHPLQLRYQAGQPRPSVQLRSRTSALSLQPPRGHNAG